MPAPDTAMAGGPLPLSIFIITRDEVDRLERTIQAVRHLSDDILVVDSGSTDGTVDLARLLGAIVVHNLWRGYGEQKRFGEDHCRHDWVLNLDADEVVPSALAAAIAGVFAATGGPAHDAYRLGIAEIFAGETAPHPWAYTLWPVRLYRRSRGRYSASPVHDRVDLAAGVVAGRLRPPIHHFSVRSLGAQIDKLNRYTDGQARDLVARGVRIPSWRLFVEFPAAFGKAYIGRRHFVRGVYGLLTAMNYAISRHLRVAKHYELRRFPDIAGGDRRTSR